MRTLPSRMMHHACTLIIPAGVTAWRATEADRTIELTRVRIERTRAITPSELDMDLKPTAELYVDARISKPAGVDFVALHAEAVDVHDYLRVSFGDRTYRVMAVRELLDDRGAVHHWELEMI